MDLIFIFSAIFCGLIVFSRKLRFFCSVFLEANRHTETELVACYFLIVKEKNHKSRFVQEDGWSEKFSNLFEFNFYGVCGCRFR